MRSLFTLAALAAATPALAFEPDLITTDVEVDSNNAPTAEVRITITNWGVDDIEGEFFCVDLFVGGAAPAMGDWAPAGQFDCDWFDIAIGEKLDFYFKVAGPIADGTDMWGIVDTDDFVPESDDTNNNYRHAVHQD